MSSKSLADKLHLKAGQRLLLSDLPAGLEHLFSSLPSSSIADRAGDADLVLAFVRDRAELEEKVPMMSGAMGEKAVLWVAYPKQSSKVPTDLNRDRIWKWSQSIGMDAVANIAVDEVWSALRLKRRP